MYEYINLEISHISITPKESTLNEICLLKKDEQMFMLINKCHIYTAKY